MISHTKNSRNKPNWNIGDVYAYKLESALAQEKGLFGRYLLLQKVNEIQWSPRIIAPIVYIKITSDDRLPQDIEEYNKLEYVQTKSSNYGERFWPYDFTRLEDDMAEKASIAYEVDEYGYLPHYRALLLLSAGKRVPPGIEYVGCFKHAAPPPIEFIPHHPINIRLVYWKKNPELFDKIIISAYCAYNLRKSTIYQQTGQNINDEFIISTIKNLRDTGGQRDDSGTTVGQGDSFPLDER